MIVKLLVYIIMLLITGCFSQGEDRPDDRLEQLSVTDLEARKIRKGNIVGSPTELLMSLKPRSCSKLKLPKVEKPFKMPSILNPAVSRDLPQFPEQIKVSTKGMHGRVEVYDEGGYRILKVGGVIQGKRPIHAQPIPHLDPMVDLVAKYRHRALVIGLGTGETAQQLTDRGRLKVVESVEIDPAVATYAKKYFGYKGPIVVEDGLKYLERTWKWYDLIIVDAFKGKSTPKHLLSNGALDLYAQRLFRGGVIAFRIIASPTSTQYINTVKRMRKILGNVRAYGDLGGSVVQNIYLIFSSEIMVRYIRLDRELALVPLNLVQSTSKRISLTGYLIKSTKERLLLSLPFNTMLDLNVLLRGNKTTTLHSLVKSSDYYPTNGGVVRDGDNSDSLHAVGGGGEIMGSGVRLSPVMVKVRGRIKMGAGIVGDHLYYNLVMDVDSIEGKLTLSDWRNFAKENTTLFKKMKALSDKPKKKHLYTNLNIQFREKLRAKFGSWVTDLKAYQDFNVSNKWKVPPRHQRESIYYYDHYLKGLKRKYPVYDEKREDIFRLWKISRKGKISQWLMDIVRELVWDHPPFGERITKYLLNEPERIFEDSALFFKMVVDATALFDHAKVHQKSVSMLNELIYRDEPRERIQNTKKGEKIIVKLLELAVKDNTLLTKSLRFIISTDEPFDLYRMLKEQKADQFILKRIIERYHSFNQKDKANALNVASMFGCTKKQNECKFAITFDKLRIKQLNRIFEGNNFPEILKGLGIFSFPKTLPSSFFSYLLSLWGCSHEADYQLSEFLLTGILKQKCTDSSPPFNKQPVPATPQATQLKEKLFTKIIDFTKKHLKGGEYQSKSLELIKLMGKKGVHLGPGLKPLLSLTRWDPKYTQATEALQCIGLKDGTLVPFIFQRLKNAYKGDAYSLLFAITVLPPAQLQWIKENKWAIAILQKWAGLDVYNWYSPDEPAKIILKKLRIPVEKSVSP
jgi:Spermine/spermidine synthase domain